MPRMLDTRDLERAFYAVIDASFRDDRRSCLQALCALESEAKAARRDFCIAYPIADALEKEEER